MCHELDALPPIVPVAGAAIDFQYLELTSADGTKFAAFLAKASDTGGAGVVVLPDVRGLYRFYEELALRFAEQGIHSIAIDYFGRTAGAGKRAAEFQCPVLGLMGGADQGIPQDQVDEYDAALEAAGIEDQLITYPGAPHSFFDRSYEEHADAAADAGQHVLAFIAAQRA